MTDLQVLTQAITALQRAQQLTRVQHVIRTAARRLVNAQGATVVLRDGEQCYYADEDAISPLWKGQRFPIDECISGWAMRHRQPAVVPDIQVDPRIPQEAYRPTFVRSLAMVPIRVEDPRGAIGVYWSRPREATQVEVARLAELAAAAAVALDRLVEAPAAPEAASRR